MIIFFFTENVLQKISKIIHLNIYVTHKYMRNNDKENYSMREQTKKDNFFQLRTFLLVIFSACNGNI